MIGVRVEKVEKTSQRQTMRTLGRVFADENRTYRLIAGADGWVRNVLESTTGSLVRKDQLMATVFNYQFLARQQQYLGALEFEDRRQKSGASPIKDQLDGTKLELYRLGVGDYQIQEITRTRKLVSEIEIRSPATGIVLVRNISTQQRFDMGTEVFRIADLSRVWIIADVFESEARYIMPGMTARVSLPHQGEVFKAVVSDVPPPFDAATRTLKVRLEVDNPGYKLRPDMFVDVELLITIPDAINVSADAVLDSGLRKTVFVDRGHGFFEPRKVETGWHLGDRIEIVEGLMPGERIVVSGNFLIDSESRMKLAAAVIQGKSVAKEEPAMNGSRKDPVCGMLVDEKKAMAAGLKSEYRGQTYYFCNDHCKIEFDEAPEAYIEKTAGEKGQSGAHNHGEHKHD